MKSKNAWASLSVYLHLWGRPFLVLGSVLAVGAAFYIYMFGHFETEFGNRTKHHVITTLDDVRLSPPTGKQGVNYTRTFVFKIAGQEVECPAHFQASPGEPIAVDYMAGASGRVYVVNVAPGEE
jgi:hypothetical protein